MNIGSMRHRMDQMNGFRLRGYLCDVQFRVGDKVFPAHRLILAARAEALLEMLGINIDDHDDSEEVVLRNTDEQLVSEALDVIYFQRDYINKVTAA